MNAPNVKWDRYEQAWVVTDDAGNRLGCVFKYIGAWFVNNASDYTKRHRTKADAVAALLAAGEFSTKGETQ